MAFTPRILDGLAAGARFMNLTGVKRGTCLNTVWRAFGSPKSDGQQSGYPWASDALRGAIAAGALHRGTIADAPPGSVLYWSNVVGNYNRNGRKVYGDAGHIGIKGNGGFWTIDATGHGSTDFVSNDALARKWPWVKFEGFAYGPGAFLGHTVEVANGFKPLPAPAAESATPLPGEEEDMPNYQHTINPVPVKPKVGVWRYLPATETELYLAKGAEIAQAVVHLRIAGLEEGKSVQVRVVAEEPTSDPNVFKQYPQAITEIIGTSGDTFGEYNIMWKTGKGWRVYLEIQTFHEDVSVLSLVVHKTNWRL